MKKATPDTPDSSASTQSLFDQMFAMSVDANKDPILPTQNPFNSTKSFVYDPLDAVLLIEASLKASSKAAQFTSRVAQCKQSVTESNSSDKPISGEALKAIEKLRQDVKKELGRDPCDDSSWRGKVPPELRLKDLLGSIELATIEEEEVWMVRGATYLEDGEKIEAGAPLFHLRGMQVVEQPRGTSVRAAMHVAAQEWCGFPRHYDQQNEWLIVNYLVPGSTIVNVVCLYTASKAAREVIRSLHMAEEDVAAGEAQTSSPSPNARTQGGSTHSSCTSSRSSGGTSGGTSGGNSGGNSGSTGTGSAAASAARTPRTPRRVGTSDRSPVHTGQPWANSIYRFWGGDDAYRNRTFKLFPRLCKSSWAIQAAVGKKPALIGNKKLELTYTRGRGYLEVDIDMSSSTIAAHILAMVRGVSKSMVVDLGIGIEGVQEDELPESILCETRFDRVDIDSGASIAAAASPSTSATGSSSGSSSGTAGGTASGSASPSERAGSSSGRSATPRGGSGSGSSDSASSPSS